MLKHQLLPFILNKNILDNIKDIAKRVKFIKGLLTNRLWEKSELKKDPKIMNNNKKNYENNKGLKNNITQNIRCGKPNKQMGPN